MSGALPQLPSQLVDDVNIAALGLLLHHAGLKQTENSLIFTGTNSDTDFGCIAQSLLDQRYNLHSRRGFEQGLHFQAEWWTRQWPYYLGALSADEPCFGGYERLP